MVPGDEAEVRALQAALKSMGASTSGSRNELKARLKEARGGVKIEAAAAAADDAAATGTY